MVRYGDILFGTHQIRYLCTLTLIFSLACASLQSQNRPQIPVIVRNSSAELLTLYISHSTPQISGRRGANRAYAWRIRRFTVQPARTDTFYVSESTIKGRSVQIGLEALGSHESVWTRSLFIHSVGREIHVRIPNSIRSASAWSVG